MQRIEAHPRLRVLRLGLWALALGAGVAGQLWLVVDPQPGWDAGAWALAAVAFIALYFSADRSRALPASSSADLSAAVEWAWLLALLAVGVFFVFYRIDEIPAGLNHDAAWEGLYALRILNGEPYTPYTSEAWGRETLTFYFRAVAIWWYGPTLFAVQAPGLLAGVLTLPFFYGWIRSLFGARMALIATLFLAVAGWHVVFSRTGWRSDFQPLFMAATCYFFFRGMRAGRIVDFLLAGVALALTLNTYNGSRVFPAVFAAWVPLVALQSWRLRTFLRRYGLGLVFFALAFAIAIAPLALYAVENWDIFMGRASALRGASSFADALQATLLLFNVAGNGDDFFIREPALEVPTAVFFVFGLLWAILRVRDQRAQFLLIGLVVNLVPGLVSKPNLNRDIGTMIFVFAFAGMGAWFFARQLRELVPRGGAAVGAAFLLVAATAATHAGYRDYLSDDRRAIWGYYPETTVLGRYLKRIARDYDVWVGGANFPRDSLTYLSYLGGPDPMRRNYTWVDDVRTLLRMPVVGDGPKGLAFVLAADGPARSVFAELERRYPQHEVVELRYPKGGRVFARALLVHRGAARSGAAASSDREAAAPAPAADTAATAPGGTLQQPRGVAVAPDGSIVVADFGHHRVQVFDAELRFVRQWGHLGDGNGEFREPSAVDVGADGRIFVADTWNGRIQSFAPDGRHLANSREALYGPRGVAVDTAGLVYAADTGNSRIVVFSADLERLRSWGERGSDEGQMLEPIGIAIAPDGDVWVADNGNGRVQAFAPDGTLRGGFAVPGWTSAVFSEPRLAFAADGALWVTVPRERQLRVYGPDGELRESMDVAARFDMPMGLDIAAERVVVTGLNGEWGRFR